MRRGMNERIQKLREQSVNAVPHIYMERADLETDKVRRLCQCTGDEGTGI